MCCALAEAKKAGESGEVPVGCVIVHDNEIVASAGNSCIKDNSPLRHAEVNAIEIACKKAKNYRLTDHIMFVTLEPCQMCAGALYWSQISRIVYGAEDKERGFQTMGTKLHPKTKLKGGIMADEASALLKRFFIEKRNLN